MPRNKKPEDQRRVILTLTIHPEIREWADSINGRRRRSIPHVFEELIEAEWQRFQARGQTALDSFTSIQKEGERRERRPPSDQDGFTGRLRIRRRCAWLRWSRPSFARQ